MTRTRRRVVEMLRAYLAASGWRQSDLSRATGINKALVSQVLSGIRDLSARNALLIEQATRAAKEAGSVTVEPLLVSQMLPELSTEPARGAA